MTTQQPAADRGGPWVFVALFCTALTTLPFVVVGTLSALARAVVGPQAVTGSSGALGLLPHPAELAGLMAFAAPVWFVGAVAAAFVPGLATRSRLLLAACGPATVAAVLVGLTNAGGLVAALDALVIAAVGWVVVSVLRRTWLEAEAPAP